MRLRSDLRNNSVAIRHGITVESQAGPMNLFGARFFLCRDFLFAVAAHTLI